jgi:hypothetical protein
MMSEILQLLTEFSNYVPRSVKLNNFSNFGTLMSIEIPKNYPFLMTQTVLISVT